jgi:hypothetical protein
MTTRREEIRKAAAGYLWDGIALAALQKFPGRSGPSGPADATNYTDPTGPTGPTGP